MTLYASTYATSALLKLAGLHLRYRSANFSMSLSIFWASPGRRNPWQQPADRSSRASSVTTTQPLQIAQLLSFHMIEGQEPHDPDAPCAPCFSPSFPLYHIIPTT
jgi:hypothetical protein